MAFWEYQDAGWKHADAFGDYVLSLAWWMIHVHKTLERTRNTAYAYEGLIHAYRLAKTRGNAAAAQELAWVVDQGLYKLTCWQVGGPLQFLNGFLSTNPTDDPLAVGGVLNHPREAPLRIDVLTQLTGIEFGPAFARRLEADFAGVRVPVIGREDFLANKRATGRVKDLADAERLDPPSDRGQ